MGACYSATAQTHSLPTPSTMHMLAELRARMRSIDAAKAKTESNRTLAHVTDSTLIPWSKVSLAKKRNLWAVNVLRACLFGDGSKEIAFINWICLLLNRGKKSPCAHDNTLHKTQLRPMWGLPTVIPYVWSSDKSNHFVLLRRSLMHGGGPRSNHISVRKMVMRVGKLNERSNMYRPIRTGWSTLLMYYIPNFMNSLFISDWPNVLFMLHSPLFSLKLISCQIQLCSSTKLIFPVWP